MGNQIFLVNYSNNLYRQSRIHLNNTCKKHGITDVVSWSEDDFKKTEFYVENLNILSQPRGNGYWLWKPYIISDLMSKASNDDYIIYADAGTAIIKDLQTVLEVTEENNGFFNSKMIHKNSAWTKRDCFYYTNSDSEEFYNDYQSDASFIIFKKTLRNIELISAWLEYCRNENILTDMPNVSGLQNRPEFNDHRHDQSVLSLLIKHNNYHRFIQLSQFKQETINIEYSNMNNFEKDMSLKLNDVYINHTRFKGDTTDEEKSVWKKYIK